MAFFLKPQSPSDWWLGKAAEWYVLHVMASFTIIKTCYLPVNAMSIATALAGVNMRLEVGAIREMHWHNDGEVYDFLFLC